MMQSPQGHILFIFGLLLGMETAVEQHMAECKRIGFVHIPKTGGTSVMRIMQSDQRLSSLLLPRLASDPYFKYHSPAIVQSSFFGDAWGHAFTFATVRNPYLLVVSEWLFYSDYCKSALLQPLPGLSQQHLRRCEIILDQFAAVANESIAAARGKLLGYVTYRYSEPSSEEALFLGQKSLVGQLSWLTDVTGKTILVDQVVKLEDLDTLTPSSLVQHACGAKTGHADSAAPGEIHVRENPTSMPHLEYWCYHTEKSCDRVAGRFQEDFAYFNYSQEECYAHLDSPCSVVIS